MCLYPHLRMYICNHMLICQCVRKFLLHLPRLHHELRSRGAHWSSMEHDQLQTPKPSDFPGPEVLWQRGTHGSSPWPGMARVDVILHFPCRITRYQPQIYPNHSKSIFMHVRTRQKFDALVLRKSWRRASAKDMPRCCQERVNNVVSFAMHIEPGTVPQNLVSGWRH